MTVKKRDGDIEEFKESKIVRVIKLASSAVKIPIDDDLMTKLVKFVVSKVSKLEEPIEIEDIQNAVEDSLMKYNLYDIERAFHDKRVERSKIRFKAYQINKEMEEKLAASNIQNSNANMDESSHGGRKGEMINSYLKNEALDYRINQKFAKLHKNNHIYEHDLDSWALGMHNCLSIPFDDWMEDGIITRQVYIRPCRSVSTFTQLIAVGKQLQSLQQFGGVAATHIDTSAVPYIRYSLMKHYLVAWLKLTGEFNNLNLVQMAMDDYEEEDTGIWHNRLEDWIDDRKTQFLKETGLAYKDFYIGNEKLDSALYNSALYDTIREIKQSVEAMLHNLNSLQSRSGNQLPFSSINYGLETSEEGRLFTNAILHNTIKGVGNGMTSIFPCQIFQLKDGINTKPGDKNFDLFELAIRSSAKRMYPNYVNCDWSVQKAAFEKSQALKKKALDSIASEEFKMKVASLPWAIQDKLGFHFDKEEAVFKMNDYEQPFEASSTMGCRTWNGFDINFTEEYFLDLLKKTVETGKLPKNYLYSAIQKDGRGNICPSTIILPTYAMEAKKKAEKDGHPEYSVDYFMKALEKAIEDCKDELIERFNWICAQTVASASFMWENNAMKGYIPEEGIRSAMKHGTLAIGQIGMAETLQILLGCNQLDPRGMELAKRIEQLYKDKCNEYKEKYHLNFGVYYTPAESLAMTSYDKFLKKYKLIENVTAFKDSKTGELKPRGYFTNSIHVPVWEKISPFQKIDCESQLVGYSSAGCITYVEIGDNAEHNLKALMQLVLYAKAKDITYFAVNVPISECTNCGYNGHIKFDSCCPKCGAEDKYINHYARVTGYLSVKYQHFNRGKQFETKDREEHVQFWDDWVLSEEIVTNPHYNEVQMTA